MSEQLLKEFRERAERLVAMPDLNELQGRGTRLRRIRIAASAAVVACAVAIGGVVATSAIRQQDVIAPATGENENLTAPERPTGLPPDGAAPSGPATGQLVASMWSHYSSNTGSNGSVYVYADGRLIWQNFEQSGDNGWHEQRLTAKGVELVRAEILATGLFDPDRPPAGSELGLNSSIYGDIQVRNGDRLSYVAGQPGRAWMPDFDRVHKRLAELQSWLPASAWEDQQTRAYVPSRYFVCMSNHSDGVGWKTSTEPASVVRRLPGPAEELLAQAQPIPAEALASADLHLAAADAAAMNYFVDEVDSLPCFDITTEETRALDAALADYAFGTLVYGVPDPPDTAVIWIWPRLPHGVPAGAYQ